MEKTCVAILLAEFGMGFTRYRSLIWFGILTIIAILGLAITLVLIPFRRKNAIK
jgi:hypothetical protein